MTTYWHMQMHPDDILFAEERVHSILESKKIIGHPKQLGDMRPLGRIFVISTIIRPNPSNGM